MANSVDPDEMAHDEPSLLDLHCLKKYQSWLERVDPNQFIMVGSHIILFLFFQRNICWAYSLEAPWHGIANEYLQHVFLE